MVDTLVFWLFGGYLFVGMWLLCGWYVFVLWLLCGWYVFELWLFGGRCILVPSHVFALHLQLICCSLPSLLELLSSFDLAFGQVKPLPI